MVVKEVVNWSSGYAVIGLSISAFAEVKRSEERRVGKECR